MHSLSPSDGPSNPTRQKARDASLSAAASSSCDDESGPMTAPSWSEAPGATIDREQTAQPIPISIAESIIDPPSAQNGETIARASIVTSSPTQTRSASSR